VLDTPERIADFLREQNRMHTVATFQVVFLNTRKRLIAVEDISQGTLDTRGAFESIQEKVGGLA
jgi:DNA repair protein RadC